MIETKNNYLLNELIQVMSLCEMKTYMLLDKVEKAFQSFLSIEKTIKLKNEELISDEFNIFNFILFDKNILGNSISNLRKTIFEQWISKYSFSFSDNKEIEETSSWLFNDYRDCYKEGKNPNISRKEAFLLQVKNFLVLVYCFYEKSNYLSEIKFNTCFKDFYPNIIFSQDISPYFYQKADLETLSEFPYMEIFFHFDKNLNNIYIYEELLKIYSDAYSKEFTNFKKEILLYAYAKSFLEKENLNENILFSLFKTILSKNDFSFPDMESYFSFDKNLVNTNLEHYFETIKNNSIKSYTQIENKKLGKFKDLLYELNNKKITFNSKKRVSFSPENEPDININDFANDIYKGSFDKISKRFELKNKPDIHNYLKKDFVSIHEKMYEKKYYKNLSEFYELSKNLDNTPINSLQALFILVRRNQSNPLLFKTLTNKYATYSIKNTISKKAKDEKEKVDNIFLENEKSKENDSYNDKEELNSIFIKKYHNILNPYNNNNSIRKLLKFFLIDILEMKKNEFQKSLDINTASIVSEIIHKNNIDDIYFYDFLEDYFLLKYYFNLKEKNNDFLEDFKILKDLSLNLDIRSKKEFTSTLAKKEFNLSFNKDLEYIFEILMAFKIKSYLKELKNLCDFDSKELILFQEKILKEVLNYKNSKKKNIPIKFIKEELSKNIKDFFISINKILPNELSDDNKIKNIIYDKVISLGDDVIRENNDFKKSHEIYRKQVKINSKIYFTDILSNKELLFNNYNILDKYKSIFSLMLNIIFYDEGFEYSSNVYDFMCISNTEEIKYFIESLNKIEKIGQANLICNQEKEVKEIYLKDIILT